MFGQNLEVQLNSAKTEDTTVVWKSFHDRSLPETLGCRARVIAPVEDDPEAIQLSSASCLPGCGIFDKSVTLSDP